MSQLEYRLASTILRIAGWFFSLLPLRADRIVLTSPRSNRLEGNLRWIAAAIEARYPSRRPVVLVETYGYGPRAKIGYLLRAIRGMYYLRTSPLVVVDNAYLPVHVAPHGAGTTVVQVWHAVSAVKRFGVDTAIPPREPERTFLHRYYDQVVVSAPAVRAVYAAALRTPIERVIALGTPRTDFFFDQTAMDQAQRRLLAAHPALVGRRVVLHAPTLRGRGQDKRSAAQLDPAFLRSRLPPGYALVLKTHPNVDQASVPTHGYDLILGAADDINDALALADVLVTDYSSAIFEFALLRRPIILLVGDLDEYAQDPGLAIDLQTGIIGTKVVDTEGVIDALLENRFDLSGYDAFIEHHLGACDGHASARFVERFVAATPQSRPRS